MSSLSNKLQETLKSIQVTDEEYDNAIAKHKEVRKAILQKIDGYPLITGSYVKKTGIRPLNDVDILVWLPKSFAGISSIDMIDKANPRQVLKKMKSVTKSLKIRHEAIRPQNHSLGIQYRGDTFRIDLIPGFAREDPTGSNSFNRLFWTPDKETGEWLNSHPKVDRARMITANRKGNQLVIPVLQLLKAWKNQLTSKSFKSYHLECLLVYLADHKPHLYSSDFYSVFRDAVTEILELVEDDTDITSILKLENDPAAYLRKQEGRKHRCIREMRHLKGTLDRIDQICQRNVNQAINQLVGIFGSKDNQKGQQHTKVSPEPDNRRFGHER
ncbi:MAG: SMODS domain-containing nucleotidyltransferase [Candidatus Hodarchaeales archaeon]|jgi:hypothetical protein